MKRFAIVALTLLFCSICIADTNWSINLLGNFDNDIVVGAGRVIAPGTEIGLSVAMYSPEDIGTDSDVCVGPYIATEFEIPGNPFAADITTYAGISPQIDVDTAEPLCEFFVAGILYPDRQVSPVLVARYNWLDDDLVAAQTDIVDGFDMFMGLRAKF